MIVWVRLPRLPVKYYDCEFLMRISSKVGNFTKIDEATNLVSRGRFVRLCVEVDITKLFLAKFSLRNKIRRIEYEGIDLVWFKCNVYGHSSDKCKQGVMEITKARTMEEHVGK